MGCKQSKQVKTQATATRQTTASTNPKPTGDAQGTRVIPMSNETFKLPTGCEEGTVKSVLSGNRIQLEDGRDVTLLGVKAPNGVSGGVSPNTAQGVLTSLCPAGSKVYLESDKSLTTAADGSALRYLYTKDAKLPGSDNVTFANYESLRSGLTQYESHDGAKLQHSTDLLKAAREARLSKLGEWKNFDSSATVHAVPQGSVYHRETCEKIVAQMHLIELTSGDAMDEGLSPCTVCKP